MNEDTTTSYVVPYNDTHRLIRFVTILPLTSGKERRVDNYRLSIQASVYLALLAFPHVDRTEHDAIHVPALLPELSARIQQNCSNVLFDLQLYDTQFSNLQAARELLPLLQQGRGGGIPVGAIGAARSAVSATVSALTSTYGIPQISGSSTASSLDNTLRHPLFGRTVPNNDGEATAFVLCMKQFLSNSRNVAILYTNDDYGISYHSSLLKAANEKYPELNFQSFVYGVDSIQSAVESLHNSGLRYIFAILGSRDLENVLRTAAPYGLTGPDTLWLFSEASNKVLNPTFVLDKESDADLATALNGTGVMMIDIPEFAPLDNALRQLSNPMGSNATSTLLLREDFVSRFAEAEVLQNYNFSTFGQSFYQYLAYDAMASLALAACEASQPYFTGPELFQQYLQTEFEGASGFVAFDKTTGTRKGNTFQYRIENLLVDEKASDEDPSFFHFKSHTSLVAVDLPSETLEVRKPFIFKNGGTSPPPDLPPVTVEMNLIPRAVQIVGWSLSAVLIVASIYCASWTVKNRNKDVVRAAQPPFLLLLCFGTFVMASSIIPMGFQEPLGQVALDGACMSVPWLSSLGFVTAFAALFSKTSRLNRVFRTSVNMRRVKVKAYDVLLPFACVFGLDVILLVAWTVAAPLTWERKPVENFDEFGRNTESIGSCVSKDGNSLAYLAPVYAINVVSMLYAYYEAYKARNIPSEFSESGHISMSIFALVETSIIAAPLLFVLDDDPTTIFMVRTILVTLWCLAILVPCFLPKYRQSLKQRNRSNVHVYIGTERFAVSRFGSRRTLARSATRAGISRNSIDRVSSGRDLGQSRVIRKEEFYEELDLRRSRIQSRSQIDAALDGVFAED